MSKLAKIINKIFPSQQAKRVKPWVTINGDKTLRLDYDLNASSLVFDLGGYEGQWSSDIFSKYQCNILVFEPFRPFALNIRNRFYKNEKIRVFDFGLGKADEKINLYSNKDASSSFKQEGDVHEIEIKNATNFIRENHITQIDLMKVNIEGGEYDLLEELISSGLIIAVKNIQVQFHDFVPDALYRMKKIHSALLKTHSLSYQYEFVWENWVLN